MSGLPFRDREDAGRRLAEALARYRGMPGLVVLALPRGGVPVGFEVARALGVPLDVFVVRKLGAPGHEELAMGAIASGGIRVVSPEILAALRIPPETVDQVAALEAPELRRREAVYRGGRPPLDVTNRPVLLVDDGLATGATMRAAVESLRRRGVGRLIVAAPVGAAPTCAQLERVADEVICLYSPDPFHAVGAYYENFEQTGVHGA